MSTTQSKTGEPLNGFLHLLARFAFRYGIYIIFLILVVVMSILSPVFLTVRNLSNVLLQNADIGIICVGTAYVIIARGIDVSMGAVVALGSAVAVTAMKAGGAPWYVGLLLFLLVGLIVGLVNGVSVAYLGMPSFLVTLATMTIGRGLVLAISGGKSYYGLPAVYSNLGAGYVGPIPNVVIGMVIIFVIGYIVLSKTVFGRRVYAVGSNEVAAQVSGIRVKRMILYTFVVNGLLAAVASMVLSARLNSFSASMGTGYEFSAIAAVVIGGVSLYGGEGNMGGVFVGMLIIGVVNNALNLLGVSAFYQGVARGGIIFLAVLIDSLRSRYARNFD